MSGSAAPGVNTPSVAPTAPMPSGTTGPSAGLINASTVPATSATSAQNVAGYNPSSATAYGAAPSAFTVAPNQTVSGQISNIIASGSPLMQEATANANQQMNQRGLINSSQAITAGQSALYQAAEPIAAADAQTYAQAATNTTQAQNAASLQNAQTQSQTSQFNAGQINSALASEAQQANQMAQAMATIQGNEQASIAVQNLTDQNKTLLQTSAAAQNLYQQVISGMATILTNANLNTSQQAAALNDQIAQLQDGLAALQGIANNQQVTSTLSFGGANGIPVGAPAAAPAAAPATSSSSQPTPEQVAQLTAEAFGGNPGSQ